MKINPLSQAVAFLNRVQEKKDSGGDSSGQQKNPRNPYQQKKGKQLDEKDVLAAVEGFQKDAQTQANGLTVATEGSGPGLRIVLKDAQGAVLRQFTGEEFVQLREASSQDAGSRGKILDQKL